LYSRNYLDEQIKVSFERDRIGTFLLLDIDNFKHINDTYGHQIGDQVLIQIADIIKSKMKIGSVGARWGGEELAIYLPNCSLNEGLRLGKELVYLTSILTNPRVTISCGVSTWDQNQRETSFTLFKKADEGLYEAKNKGKNRAVAVVN
jgi:diguanylate cyclase (GGDEF)-like protein